MGSTRDLASNYFGDTLPQGQAGPLGLLVIVLLGVGLWLLIKSMNRHLRKLPTSFDPAAVERRRRGEPDPPPAAQAAAPPAAPPAAPAGRPDEAAKVNRPRD